MCSAGERRPRRNGPFMPSVRPGFSRPRANSPAKAAPRIFSKCPRILVASSALDMIDCGPRVVSVSRLQPPSTLTYAASRSLDPGVVAGRRGRRAGSGPRGRRAGQTAGRAERRGVSRQVEPLLAKYCQKCHSGAEPKGELALETFPQTGRRGRRTARCGKRSPQKLRSGEMPPEEQPQPAGRRARDSWRPGSTRRWLEFDCGGERDPGRVTIRRLNRNEYNNTIRDLVGRRLPARPTISPPTTSATASTTSATCCRCRRCCWKNTWPPPRRSSSGPWAPSRSTWCTGEIEGGQIIEGGARDPAERRPKCGPSFGLSAQGDYILRVRAYGEQAGDEPVKMGVYLDNELVRSFDVKAAAGQAGSLRSLDHVQGRPAHAVGRVLERLLRANQARAERSQPDRRRPGGDGPLPAHLQASRFPASTRRKTSWCWRREILNALRDAGLSPAGRPRPRSIAC